MGPRRKLGSPNRHSSPSRECIMAPRSASQALEFFLVFHLPSVKNGHQTALTAVVDHPLLDPKQDRGRAGELSNVCTPPSGPSPPAAAGRWPGGWLDRNDPEGPRVRPLGRGVTVAGVSGAPASGANLTPAPLPLLSCRAAMEAVEGARSVSMLAGAPVTRGCPAPQDCSQPWTLARGPAIAVVTCSSAINRRPLHGRGSCRGARGPALPPAHRASAHRVSLPPPRSLPLQSSSA